MGFSRQESWGGVPFPSPLNQSSSALLHCVPLLTQLTKAGVGCGLFWWAETLTWVHTPIHFSPGTSQPGGHGSLCECLLLLPNSVQPSHQYLAPYSFLLTLISYLEQIDWRLILIFSPTSTPKQVRSLDRHDVCSFCSVDNDLGLEKYCISPLPSPITILFLSTHVKKLLECAKHFAVFHTTF